MNSVQKYWFNKFFLPKLKARTNKIVKPRVDFFSNNFKKYSKKNVLDIGAGLGAFLLELKKKWPQASLFALEPSKLMAKKCRDRNIKVFEKQVAENNKLQQMTLFDKPIWPICVPIYKLIF